jgi:protease secretion system outer membrane protein
MVGRGRRLARAGTRTLALALGLATALSLRPGPASAAGGLVEDFRAALAADPTWQAAIAARDAGVEAREQGRAGLLPQLSLSAAQGKASTDRTFLAGNQPTIQRDRYDTYNYSLQFRQPLFRMRAWAAFAQGKAQAAYAEEGLKAARQDLALRVVAAYAEWAAVAGDVDSSRTRVGAQEVLLRSAERNLQGGDATRVDVEVVRGRLAEAQARLVDAEGQLQAAMLNWRQITGRAGLRPGTPAVRSDTGEKLALDPGRLEEWQSLAMASSGQVRALRFALEAAREEARKVRADHYPTLDLFASRTLSESDTDVTINQKFDSTRLSLQLNLPIYAGGAVDSQVRQALANVRRAEGELEAEQQKLRLQIERDWHALVAARAGANAALRVLEAAQLAGHAARLGIPAGNATLADVASAALQEADGRRDLVLANARALATWARLMAATDRLDENSLAQVDALLGSTALAAGGGGVR